MIKYIAIFLLRLIELFQYGEGDKLQLRDKIISEIDLNGVEIESDNGFQPIKKIFQTKPYSVWNIKLIHNKEISHTLTCADEHLLFWKNSYSFSSIPEWKAINNISKGDYVKTDKGWREVAETINLGYTQSMFDVEVDSKQHSYFSNGILSHNTTTAAIFVAWYMIFNHEKHAIYVSKTYKDAKEVLNKTKGIIENLPFYMKPGILNCNESKLYFDNKCSITAVSTTRSAGVGHTLNLLYMDEFAHIHPGFVDDFYENAIPTLAQDPNSKLIITSTPKGYNKFYELWKGATSQVDSHGLGANKFKGLKIDWWEVPGRDEEWRMDETQRLGSEEAFNEQYGNQFLTSSKLLLENKILQKFKDSQVTYKQASFDAFTDNNLDHPITFAPDYDVSFLGETNDRFVIAVDVGEGAGEDYSAITGFKLELMSKEELEQLGDYKSVYDIFKLVQVFKFANNSIDPKELAKYCYMLFMEILDSEKIKVVLEWNALGQALYNSIYLVYPERNDMYDEMFVKHKHRTNDKVARIGLRYTGRDSKNFWSLNFRDATNKNRVEVNENETVEQLSFFGKTETKGYHGQTGNDDLAINAINATSILDTPEWFDLVDDYIESLDEFETDQIEDIIQRRLEAYDDKSEEGFMDLFSEEANARDTYFD